MTDSTRAPTPKQVLAGLQNFERSLGDMSDAFLARLVDEVGVVVDCFRAQLAFQALPVNTARATGLAEVFKGAPRLTENDVRRIRKIRAIHQRFERCLMTRRLQMKDQPQGRSAWTAATPHEEGPIT